MSAPRTRSLIRFLPLASLAVLGAWTLAAEDEPRRVALLVGVNRSEIRIFADSPLQFAERDVQELAAVLKEQGFDVRTLTGAEATRKQIDDALTDVLKGRKARDVVVIGFAGHGVQMPLEDDEGKPMRDDRGRELSDAYFCPVDAVFGKGSTMISLTRLVERLDREGGVNLLMVDACRDNPDLHRGVTRSLSGDELIGRLPANSAILFSCSKGQQALEHVGAGGGHGVFFHHVIEGLCMRRPMPRQARSAGTTWSATSARGSTAPPASWTRTGRGGPTSDPTAGSRPPTSSGT